MTSRISHTTVDAHNAYEQSVWWCQVLGFGEDPQDPNRPGHEECMIFSPDGRTRVLFIEVPEGNSPEVRVDGRRAKRNRIHFDLRPDDQTAEVQRLEALGARRIDIGQGDVTWVVMEDPEGNEFCVLSTPNT